MRGGLVNAPGKRADLFTSCAACARIRDAGVYACLSDLLRVLTQGRRTRRVGQARYAPQTCLVAQMGDPHTHRACLAPQGLVGMESASGGFCSIPSQILVRFHARRQSSAFFFPDATDGGLIIFLFFFHFLDAQARLLIPSLPPLRPNDRISHHYRFIAPLMPKDDEGRSPLHYYDSAIQLARQAEREPTEREFEVGIAAADEIKKMYVYSIFRRFLWTTHTFQFIRNPRGNASGLDPGPQQASPRIMTNPIYYFSMWNAAQQISHLKQIVRGLLRRCLLRGRCTTPVLRVRQLYDYDSLWQYVYPIDISVYTISNVTDTTAI